MYSIFTKELKTYMTSLFTYIYMAMFFLVVGIFFSTNCLNNSSTEFGLYVLNKGFIVCIFFIPLCTMRLFAQEKKERTDQMLFTAPVTNLAIVTGKVLATAIVILIPLVLSILYPVIMSFYGNVSIRYTFSTYLASVLVSLVFALVGVVVSACVSNGILATVCTYAIIAVILLFRILEGFVSSSFLARFISDYSIFNRLNDIISGVIRIKDIVFLLSLIVFLFVFVWIVLVVRRTGWKSNVVKVAGLMTCFVLVNIVGSTLDIVYDMTAENVLAITDETKNIVADIKNPTTIYFLCKESRANITYKELLKKYASLNDNIEVVYEEMTEDSQIRLKYLKDLSSINEASMLVVSGERYSFLDSKEYLSEIYTTDYSFKTMLNFENLLTSAIYYVNSEEQEGLLVINGEGGTQLPVSFQNSLVLNNFYLKNISLEQESENIQNVFADEYRALFVNSPIMDYTDEELDELRWYLEHEGNIFITIDPLNEDTPNLFAFLKEYGFDVLHGVLIEGNKDYCAFDTEYYIVPELKESKYTELSRKERARIVTMTSKGIFCVDTENGYKASMVLKTSDDCFAKLDNYEKMTQRGANDISGPFAVGAISEKEGKGSIFLLSSNIFFNDEVDAESNGANRKFFVNVLNVLCGKEDAVSVEKKEVRTQVAYYPLKSMKMVKIVTIVVIPFLFLLVGMVVGIARNQNLVVRIKNGGKKSEDIKDEN